MISKNIIIKSTLHKKPISADLRYISSNEKKPLILFVHGFKGFKDWGVFNLLSEAYARKGFIFMKINLSHNGTTPEQPVDFVDLEAFGNNNFTIELNDLKDAIDYVFSENFEVDKAELDREAIHLMGHSRGGGLVLLKANEDERIKKVITLAAISDLTTRYPEEVLEAWRKNGVQYIDNARTGQRMPLYVQLYHDVMENVDRLSIPKAVEEMKQPLLNFHGTADETLPVAMARQIKSIKPDTSLVIFEDANHVFGATHPWEKNELPELFKQVVEKSSDFLSE
ncbi:alpha/beta fold hydrolase [Marivirga sp. S37H4]|uniref:Alpha/beta fold hydrolase n=1 Tax=Marivirga aurantiaca TaxID=2802615 RepID=A0A934WWF4_9BACT|nr:alpha/beta fold hydrolase [Marivirga aurantiaca]MBK6264136.1 alpha/beta fold hydrolase [Marivirga aurantiaca]